MIKKSATAAILLIAILISVIPANLSAFAEGGILNIDVAPTFKRVDEDGYLLGRLKLVMNGEEITEMTIGKGEKEYLYTKPVNLDEANLKYTWQILINKEKNRWATINDYLLNYAVISEALIENHPNDNGHATVRCIADDGENKYVSGSVEITKEPVLLFSARPALYSAGDDSESVAQVSDTNVDAFHIVINYVFRHADNAALDGKTAASPFTVTLPNTASYTGTVASPPVAGYVPYILDPNGSFEYDGERYTHAAYHSFEKQRESVTVTIHYIPSVVNYMVKYYEQNLYNDEYTYAGTVIKTGYTDTFVGADLAEPRDGFTPLAYDEETVITGDGISAVEIYYDRIYCLVDVELGEDGHGVVPYYVRYNTQLILGTPTRMGYTFRGWELTTLNGKAYDELNDAEKAAWEVYAVGSVAGTMLTMSQAVATELLYTAKWEKAVTTYSAIYWVENADDDGFTLWGYRTYNATPGDIVSAKDDMQRDDKDCFTFNEARSDKNIIVEGDGTTAVNVYYNRNYYSLVFKAGSTCYATEHTHDGTSCQRPLICGNETTHDHSAECGTPELICKYAEHTHTDECKNSCTIPPHEEHTADCLICTVEPHVHTWECYNGATSTTSGNTTVDGQKQDGYIGRSRSGRRYNYWIYVSGTWYRYYGTVAYGSQAEPNSRVCPGIHVHSDEENCYKDKLHVHTEWCCNVPEHTHDANACYQYPCGKKAHSHDNYCYGECILYEHTHSYSCNIVKVVTEKYDADISDIWPIKVNDSLVYDQGERWEPLDSSLYKNVLVYIPFMPSESVTFSLNNANYDAYTMNYYLESLPGNTGIEFEKVQYDLKNSIQAKYNYLTKAEDFFDIVGFTQYKAAPKDYDSKGQIDLSGGGTVNMYYTRNEYEVVYNNNGIVKDSESKTAKYQMPLKDYYIEPEYPSNMEAGACYFAGWYYTPTCANGTEVDFDADVMPAGDLILYAKWLPMQYNVKVYMDDTLKTLMLDKTVYFNEMVVEPKISDSLKPNPGDMPTVIPDTYIFAGWYYVDEDDNGQEKRFDFNTMMIKKDYVIYAKWTSLVPVDYVIYYKLRHADGELEEIAAPERGQALIGITKSFSAKTGEKLYTKFQKGYYPEERYVSMKMDGDESKNVFTFIYEHVETINYSLIHNFSDGSVGDEGLSGILGVNSFSMRFDYEISNASDTPAEIVISFREQVNEANIKKAIRAANPAATDAELTEAWEIVKNLSPDAYESEKILVTKHTDGQNDIVFDWAYREGKCIYQILYYKQDVDAAEGATTAENYTLDSDNSQVFMVDYEAGKKVSVPCITIPGFHVNTTLSDCTTEGEGESLKYVCEGELTKPTVGNLDGGLIMRVYYDRDMISYKVKHAAGNREIIEDRAPVRYGSVVTEVAKDVTNEEDKEWLDRYYVQGDFQKTETITVEGQEILFTYRLHVVNYYYQVVGSGLGGALSSYTEEVDVNSTPVGAIPTAAPGYVFVGWYSDAEGTVPVTKEQANVGALNNTIIPIPKSEYVGTPQYFYAKFAPTNIIIKNNNVKDSTHTFVYRMKGIAGTDTADIDLVFALVGNGSITVSNLPIGDYILTPNNDWAYRYNEGEIRFTFDDNKTVWVDYHAPSEKWIGDVDHSKNP